jgi:hypothetical protein
MISMVPSPPPFATSTVAGIVSTVAQTFGGNKTFSGSVGIGTTPTQALDVYGTSTAYVMAMLTNTNVASVGQSDAHADFRIDDGAGNYVALRMWPVSHPNTAIFAGSGGLAIQRGKMVFESITDAGGGDFVFARRVNTTTWTDMLHLDTTNYRVGILNAAPSYPLDVAGIIRSSTGGFKFPDGTVQTTAAAGGGGSVTVVTGSGFIASSGGTAPNITLSASGTPSSTTYLRGDNTWATASGSGGPTQVVWSTLYDVDFTAQSTQTIAADGNYVIDGKTWTMMNFANTDSSASPRAGIVNGVGLKISAISSSDIYAGNFSAPVMYSPLSGFGAGWSTGKVALWLRCTTTLTTGNSNYGIGVLTDPITGNSNGGGWSHMRVGKIFLSGGVQYGAAYSSISSSVQVFDTWGDKGAAYDVLCFVYDCEERVLTLKLGVWTGGWPSIANMKVGQIVRNVNFNGDGTAITTNAAPNNMHDGNMIRALLAACGASGGNISYTFTNFKVEQTLASQQALTNPGWTTKYDLDFAAQSTQTITADGNYTIGGKTWTMMNFANTDSSASPRAGIVNGVGLKISAVSAADIAGGTVTAPFLYTAASSIVSSWSNGKVAVWIRGTGVPVVQYQQWGAGITTDPVVANTNGRGYTNILGKKVWYGTGISYFAGFNVVNAGANPVAASAEYQQSYDVLCIIYDLDTKLASLRVGNWSGGWPSLNSMLNILKFDCNYTNSGIAVAPNTTNIPPNNLNDLSMIRFLVMAAGDTGGNINFTMTNFKVETWGQ